MEKILIAEDDPVQGRIISTLLTKKLGYDAVVTSNGMEAARRVKDSNIGEISAVLLDVQMPIMDGFECLKTIRQYRPDLPILMITGSDDISLAVRAIKEGANDFIVKPIEPAQLDVALKNAIKIANLSKELAKLKRDKVGSLIFSDLVGYNSGLSAAVAYGQKAAASDVPVLILGETGVGKELFARAIHGESKRADAPFIAINCGAIPENLVESILFGHEKGAFTGAINRTIGKFREADGGTIFLDEIGELPLEAQVKLLRVLQQKEVEPVGAEKPVKVNVRIISATNRYLSDEVTNGKFREDLYFRLNVLPIIVPALRDRKEDIIPLAEHFIARLSAMDNLSAKTLSKDAKEYLVNSAWTGNVRELENLLHRALILSDSEYIDSATLANIQLSSSNTEKIEERRATPPLHINLRLPDGSFKNIVDIEVEAMSAVLAHFEGNITKAADVLNIAKSTFYRKMKEKK